MFGRNKFAKIPVEEYPEMDFYPFHQISKSCGEEPFLKELTVAGHSFKFFKANGNIYCLKPSVRKRDYTKALCTIVNNIITRESAEGSITGNCARGIKEEFVRYSQTLERENLSKEEIFKRLVLPY